jgi:hypothetical protein
MKNPQATVDSIFKQVEAELSLRLLKQDFLLESQVYSDEAFGSQYTEWRNQYESYALRLVWEWKGTMVCDTRVPLLPYVETSFVDRRPFSSI